MGLEACLNFDLSRQSGMSMFPQNRRQALPEDADTSAEQPERRSKLRQQSASTWEYSHAFLPRTAASASESETPGRRLSASQRHYPLGVDPLDFGILFNIEASKAVIRAF